MRRALWFVLLLLLLPAVTASPGHGSQILPRTYAVQLAVDDEQPLGLQLSTSGALAVDDLVLLNIINDGPDDLRLTLFSDAVREREWSVPVDGHTHVLEHRLLAPGTVTLDFLAIPDGDEADDEDVYSVFRLFVDYTTDCAREPYGCIEKVLPWEVPQGRIVFPYTATADGLVRTTWSDPEVHDLAVQVLDANDMTPVAAVQETTTDGYAAVWTAVAGHRYVLVADSVRADQQRFFDSGYDYETTKVVVDTSPVVAQSTPAGVALPLVAVLGVLLTGRRPRTR